MGAEQQQQQHNINNNINTWKMKFILMALSRAQKCVLRIKIDD